MPKKAKEFTIADSHSSSGSAGWDLYSSVCGKIEGRADFRLYDSSNETETMEIGLQASDLTQIINLLVDCVNNGKVDKFKEIISRDFIFPEVLKKYRVSGSWSDMVSSGHFSMEYESRYIRPIIEVLHLEASQIKEPLFYAISQSPQKEAFCEIMRDSLKNSIEVLTDYIKTRNSEKDGYARFSFGWAKTKDEKINAAKFLKRFYLGKISSVEFFSPKNKSLRKPLKHGRLGDAYKEVKGSLPGPRK